MLLTFQTKSSVLTSNLNDFKIYRTGWFEASFIEKRGMARVSSAFVFWE